VFDVECYQNYFLLMARNIGGCAVIVYERFNDVVLVEGSLPPGTLVSFNGNNYDLPMIAYARTGASNAALKALSDAIILRNLKPWDAEREFGLIEYCGNDLLTTLDLYRKLEPQLALRVQMGREWGLDLRSKSDAQIAEAVIRKEVEGRVGHRVYRPELACGYQFQYRMPDWVSFEAPGLKQVLDIIRDARFGLEIDGSVELPPVLESMRLRIGRAVYRMGIGGLHSSETCVAHVPHGEYFIWSRCACVLAALCTAWVLVACTAARRAWRMCRTVSISLLIATWPVTTRRSFSTRACTRRTWARSSWRSTVASWSAGWPPKHPATR